MRGWVGVKFALSEKMPESLSVQGLRAILVKRSSAHLTETGFELFFILTQFLEWTMMRAIAQSNLENYIYLGFQPPAIAISHNPY